MSVASGPRVAVLAALVATTPAAAQQTFRACYVPVVGAMYFLDLPGLPTECVSQEHEVIEWTEGGSASGPIGTDDLEDGAVTAAKLASGAVGSAAIQDNSVGTADVQNGSLTGADILDGSLTGNDIELGSISGASIQNGSLTTLDLADFSVTASKLGTGSVTAAKIGLGQVSGQHLALGIHRRDLVDQVIVGYDTAQLDIDCDSGVAMAGGWFSTAPNLRVLGAAPAGLGPDRWTFRFRNEGSTSIEVSIYIVCGDLG